MSTPLQYPWREALHPALWHPMSVHTPPARLLGADDSLRADTAYRLACEGTGLVWQGDFHNARHLLDALKRRLDAPSRRRRKGAHVSSEKAAGDRPDTSHAPADMATLFHRQRMEQGRRARVLSSVLVPMDAQGRILLRRAPDWRVACAQAWEHAESAPIITPGADAASPQESQRPRLMPLRELLGMVSAWQWREKGVEIQALAQLAEEVPECPSAATAARSYSRIHPHYGVFSPVRGEYVDLVARAPLPAVARGPQGLALDIGTGTGVLAAVLARRGVGQVIATDTSARALACAAQNMGRLGLEQVVQVVKADLFADSLVANHHGTAGGGQAYEPIQSLEGLSDGLPDGLQAGLIVCNPPWLPVRAVTALEHAVYDPDSRMLRGFLNGLAARLLPGGEGWLILSDLAERLGLRPAGALAQWVQDAGLRIVARHDARPVHSRAHDRNDPLHMARSAEITTLWRLTVV